MKIKYILQIAGFYIFMIAFAFGLSTMMTSCDHKAQSTENSVLPPIEGEVLNHAVPEDGRAHIIYENKYYVIKAKVIYIQGGYTSHVVWTESKTAPGQITNLSTH